MTIPWIVAGLARYFLLNSLEPPCQNHRSRKHHLKTETESALYLTIMAILRGRKFPRGPASVPNYGAQSHPPPLRITTDEDGTEIVEEMPLASSNEPSRPYEDFKSHFLGHVYPSIDSLRIRWPVFGELSDILVVDDATDPFAPTKPFQLPDSSLHPVANPRVSDISSIKVGIDCLGELSSYTFRECECEDIENDDGTVQKDCHCGIYYRKPDPVLVVGDNEGSAIAMENLILTLCHRISVFLGVSPRLHSAFDSIPLFFPFLGKRSPL
ncbi:hypothetical protein P152DRAFT_461648 [Eremomyces bilateralis CBS 781.70]|uniref:Uncharacterized protein n=1 Tax=Eremomyces bilateralis CBS 781.70 TaxID=1392243 RepID=A0A6G1FTZ1_9PEZI|nr:uncharacterized protein P152DRAFT_461648 [Eremomyces bilateralis CBS 781.70]KAF1809223.1 hypothetical protein P152DRAFT_461648 [Eremomyces bilateralis CBS 781.70]